MKNNIYADSYHSVLSQKSIHNPSPSKKVLDVKKSHIASEAFTDSFEKNKLETKIQIKPFGHQADIITLKNEDASSVTKIREFREQTKIERSGNVVSARFIQLPSKAGAEQGARPNVLTIKPLERQALKIV